MLDTISFTSVQSNLEHGLVILTESFSLLRSVLHNLSCWSPMQKCALREAIPIYIMYTATRSSWFDLVSTCLNWLQSLRLMQLQSTKCLVENSIADGLKSKLTQYLAVTLTTRGQKPNHLALFPCFFVLSYWSFYKMATSGYYLKYNRYTTKGLFTPTGSEKDQRINGKHQRNFSLSCLLSLDPNIA